ncbi:hypothetical protein FACS1894125_0090 [Actinomycetota bacterium]|nr:hypothetical protein FACS1894125_0090 [Actinomycetota bacterium]
MKNMSSAYDFFPIEYPPPSDFGWRDFNIINIGLAHDITIIALGRRFVKFHVKQLNGYKTVKRLLPQLDILEV